MFARFRPNGRRLTVSLLRSVRPPGRAPRSELVASLGSVDPSDEFHRSTFWSRVGNISYVMADMSPAQRATLRAALEARIPRPGSTKEAGQPKPQRNPKPPRNNLGDLTPVRGKVQYDHVDVIEARWRGEKATAVVNAIRPALELLRKGLPLLDEFSSDEEFVQALGGTAVSGRNFEKWARS